jgi:hypothetical protein
MIKKYRKKPIVVEAIKFDATSENLVELSEFLSQRTLVFDPQKEQIIIETWEGDVTASKGDWIIKGIKGEFYPCKPDVFEATYEPA